MSPISAVTDVAKQALAVSSGLRQYDGAVAFIGEWLFY